VKTARVAGAFAGFGAIVIEAAPRVALALAGFALLGVGVAVIVPPVFAAASRVGPRA
jgi:hypothetical protein